MDKTFIQSDYFKVLIPLIGLALNSSSQVLIIRYIKKIGMLKSIIAGFCLGFAAVVYLGFFSQGKILSDNLLTNLFIYISLGYCYFHFINLGETARRIRILTEIYNSKDGLDLEGILNKYNAKIILDARLKRLISNKQIRESITKYYISNPMLLFSSKLLAQMKILLLGKKSPFSQ